MSSVTDAQPLKLRQTPLHAWHRDHGGRMVDFAGWELPTQYGSIMDEHHQTRNAVGMFDVSHMGRIWFHGDSQAVGQWLDGLTTRRIAGIAAGKIRYSLICREDGGVLDDVLVYHLPQTDSASSCWMMVCNASNRDKIVRWLSRHIGDRAIRLDDRTEATAMIAVQGPLANQQVAQVASIDPATLDYYTGASCQLQGTALVTRTGYTGEDGCEIICDANNAVDVWRAVYDLAVAVGGGASGLASRDSLRLEAGMPLYGHELSEDINAAQTGLRFAIELKDRDFIGKQAIIAGCNDDTLPVRVGLVLDGKRAARGGCQIFQAQQCVGQVVSGAFSPTTSQSISMAYVTPHVAQAGTKLEIDIRGKSHSAEISALPFYRRGH